MIAKVAGLPVPFDAVVTGRDGRVYFNIVIAGVETRFSLDKSDADAVRQKIEHASIWVEGQQNGLS